MAGICLVDMQLTGQRPMPPSRFAQTGPVAFDRVLDSATQPIESFHQDAAEKQYAVPGFETLAQIGHSCKGSL